MTTVLTELGEFNVAASGGLWLTADDAERVSGWVLKPEGMCRDEICVPLPPGVRDRDRVDMSGFWGRLGNPVVRDRTGEVWVLGAGAAERNRALAGSAAPDFVLPDLAGTAHRLGHLRGRKVFLATWASW
jgi:hypothetical protein